MNIPVFDFHCDTALALLGRDFSGNGDLRRNDHHIDLERASGLAGYAQCFACYTSPWEGRLPDGITVEDVFQRELAVITRELERNSDVISLAKSVEDITENYQKGRMSGILTIEGPAGFGYDPNKLAELYEVGFRVSTLGWNEKNTLTGSHVTGGGLTERGREYVREAQRLGMIVDVSHISDEGFWDILEISRAPVIASHSNSRQICGSSRNLTDDMFRAICQSGGVAGFNLYSAFIGDNPDLDTACKHFLHFLELDPEGRHIALGGDLDGCDMLPTGFNGVQDYNLLAEKLKGCGLDTTMIENIFWNNALEVMNKCST